MMSLRSSSLNIETLKNLKNRKLGDINYHDFYIYQA